MDFCAICLLVLLWKGTISSPIITEGDSTTTSSEEIPENMVEMGRALRTIPSGDENVKTVNFGYNRLTSLPAYAFYFKGYRYLNKIELCQNKIINISQKAFRELKLLKQVDLSGNNISCMEPATFKSNNKLEKLDLSNNKISFHPSRPFLNSPSLVTLILNDNRIEQIFEISFFKLPKLRNLMMDNNMIFIIEAQSFAPLRHLQYLSLANTEVDRLNQNMFRDNWTLPRIVDVTDTPLANKFNPKLKKVKNEAVMYLLNIDKYF